MKLTLSSKVWMTGLILGGSSIAATSARAGDAKVCFEGESAVSLTKPLVIRSDKVKRKGFSGSGYLEIPWDKNATKGIGQANYKVHAAKGGTYYLWARTFWANGCGNSIIAVVNGGSPKILGQDGTYDKWHWIGGTAKVTLKAGMNSIVLKNRETGVAVDQVFLTQDANYIPQNIRPVTH